MDLIILDFPRIIYKLSRKDQFWLIKYFSCLAATRHKRDTEDDIQNAVNDAERELKGIMDKFYGGVCVQDDNCLTPIAYCDKNAGATAGVLGNLAIDGQCRPNIWVWLVLAGIVLLFLGACICCICCGLCKCLYK